MLDLFTTRENIYNSRNFRKIYCEKNKTMRCGTETVTYKAAQLLELSPYDIKNSSTLVEFKDRTKTWSPDNCPCCLCKTHLKNIGYIDIANTFSVTQEQLLF